MNVAQLPSETAIATPTARGVDIRLEVAVISVADIDRAKHFYSGLGWRLDADLTGDGFRVIQFTPPGSPCSVVFGSGTRTEPYAQLELDVLRSCGELVVSDIEVARAELADRGVDVSEVFHYAGSEGRVIGPDPERRSYLSWASFSDPAGNIWMLQEVTARAPGRVDTGETTFASSTELAAALRRASVTHGEHEKRTGGQRDENWPDWYAQYMAAEKAGKALPI
ncbi:glyoxalase [Mesorhizobium sp. LNHC221B00]|uniref:VOC family protein n=1 Tax=Mesorhizobium sp. LNHC221B00 TaxID=1287233 RepID=UPI0003CF8B89|nr:VOC family protein [Mesorhizobium sp. LNHC221B00]ESY78208.1 glyoxalase [Mesorhizobium sp. LNHC221B00]